MHRHEDPSSDTNPPKRSRKSNEENTRQIYERISEAVYASLKQPQYDWSEVDKCVATVDADTIVEFFNYEPKSDASALYFAFYLSSKGKPDLLAKFLALSPEKFQQLNFNALAQSWQEHEDYGSTNLWGACCSARGNKPEFLNRILTLTPEKFQELDFDAGPKNTESFIYGITVFWFACCFALEGKTELLNKILTLPLEVFQKLNFEARPQNQQHSEHGVTVFWLACDLALKDKPELLDKILTLPPEVFSKLNSDAGPLDTDHARHKISIVRLAAKLVEKNKPELWRRILAERNQKKEDAAHSPSSDKCSDFLDGERKVGFFEKNPVTIAPDCKITVPNTASNNMNKIFLKK